MAYKADKFRQTVLAALSTEIKGKVSGSQSFFDSSLADVARKFENESLSSEDALKNIIEMLKKFSVYISSSDANGRALKKSLDTLIRSL